MVIAVETSAVVRTFAHSEAARCLHIDLMMIRRSRQLGHAQLVASVLIALALIVAPAWITLGRSAERAVFATAQSASVAAGTTARPEIGGNARAAVKTLVLLAKRARQSIEALARWESPPTTRSTARGFIRRPLPSNRELRETYTNVIAWPGYNNAPINPIADWENCAACAIALDHTLEGSPTQALPYTRYAAALDPEERVVALAKNRQRFKKAADGLDYVLKQSLLASEIEPELATKYTRLREELAMVVKRPPNLRSASDELKEQMLISDLFSYYDQPDVIARNVRRKGGDWTDHNTMREALDVAADWPDRAKAIVWVETGEDYAHVFNLLRHKGKTVLMDGQIGAGYRRGTFDRATSASLLRTEAVPAWVDLDAMRLPKAIEDVKDVE